MAIESQAPAPPRRTEGFSGLHKDGEAGKMTSIFLKTFALIFMAELGDKTQLATLAVASGRPDGKVAVFLGAAIALVTTSLIAVLAGDAISRIPGAERACRVASGILFLVFGAITLAEAFRH